MSEESRSRSSSPSSSSGESQAADPSITKQDADKDEFAVRRREIQQVLHDDIEIPAWKPPNHFRPLIVSDTSSTQFDYDAVAADDDLELWLIKVPGDLKPRHFDGLAIAKVPDSNGQVGSFTAKKATYHVIRLNDDVKEMTNFVPLLPRKSQSNDLLPTPKPIVRRLVVQHAVSIPNIPLRPDNQSVSALRHTQPKEFTFHFRPYGSESKRPLLKPAPAAASDVVEGKSLHKRRKG